MRGVKEVTRQIFAKNYFFEFFIRVWELKQL